MRLNKYLKDIGCTIEIIDRSNVSIYLSSVYFEAIVFHKKSSFRITSRVGVCSRYFVDTKGFDTDHQVFKYIAKKLKQHNQTTQG